MNRSRWRAACAAAWLVTGSAHAADDRGFHGAVGMSVQHDNNVLRLPSGQTPSDAGLSIDPGDNGSHRGDTITSPFVSLNADLALGRQHVGVSGLHRETRLDHYSAYNSHSGDLHAYWDWQLGNDFDGRIDAGSSDQATELQDFLGSRRNVLTLLSEHALVNWRPRPDRRVSLDRQRYRGSNDVPALASADYDVGVWGIEGAWITALATELNLRWRHTDGHYPNRSISAAIPVDNSYRQDDAEVGVVLRPGGRTSADVRLGYATRRHEQVPQRNFEGPSGRAGVEWQAGGALALTLDAVRDLNALADFDRLFAVSTHIALGARWVPAAQWQLAWRWSDERLVYGGDPQNLLTQTFGQTPERRDRIRSTHLALTWIPLVRVQVELSFDRSQRDSNRPGLAYASQQAGLSTSYSF